MSLLRKHIIHPHQGTISLNENDIRTQFDKATYHRGVQYQHEGRVNSLKFDTSQGAPKLSASVRGSGDSDYYVDVDLTVIDDELVCEGFCSCFVQVDCKHVVATLLATVRQGWFSAPPQPNGQMTFIAGKASVAKAERPLAGALDSWLDRLSTEVNTTAAETTANVPPGMKNAAAPEKLLYCFHVETYPNKADKTVLSLAVSRILKTGAWGSARSAGLNQIAQSYPRYATDADRAIAKLLMAETHAYGDSWPISAMPESLEWAMERILATGRAYWLSKEGVKLTRGSDHPGKLAWRLNDSGDQTPVLAVENDGLIVLPGPSPWVVDPVAGKCGKLLLSLPSNIIRSLLEAPPVSPEAAPALAEALAQRFSNLRIDAPRTDIVVTVDDSPPMPVLRLASHRVPSYSFFGKRGELPDDNWVDSAELIFNYDKLSILPDDKSPEFRIVSDNGILVRKRRFDIERQAQEQLSAIGLFPLQSMLRGTRAADLYKDNCLSFPLKNSARGYDSYVPEDPFAWPAFMHETALRLVADGWQIVIDETFRHQIVCANGDWEADVEDKGGWWFSLDLGIDVEGERIPLLPVLVSALSQLKAGQDIENLSSAGTLYGRMPDGRTLALPFERLRSLVDVLVELFGDRMPGDGTSIDLSLAQAIGLEAIAEATRLRWVGGERLRTLAGRLREGGIGAEERAIPEGFAATLRPYQQVGFGWMGFLAEQGMGGVLADDMGLGKTVQTLAHILAEKISGRMNAPFLVICPTSLVTTWQDEAARFAPALTVLTMHGLNRPRDTAAFENMDLVITTYPLLTRDSKLLNGIEWHGIVLDEAQAIKNPAAQSTLVACKLKAGHRLCLSGTPVQNHLGEAWSLFAFLMPGLLGDMKTFTKIFRNPIEKKNDAARRHLLSRRLKPFLLRRTKSEVAIELPPKTEMVRWVDLSGGQRDLYETVRLAMDEKVREAVKSKGLARSSIVILDALLKLRQACCDPRLVKLKTKSKVAIESAKLDHLMELLPTLVEDGRRILLFSQFTSMLDLIKPELRKASIPFVELTGDTVDRKTPVRSFQNGEVPVFLISLKAGGTGLTLTAADTVIHYDPWWNPAMEDQATDRAHRIGQDKPVFVYKLLVTGSVEARMLELQARKRTVAAALFDPDNPGSLTFTEEDLAALFRPMA